MAKCLIADQVKKTSRIIAFGGLLFFVNFSLAQQAPEWIWGNGIGGLYNEGWGAMKVDGEGNTYVAGAYISNPMIVGSYLLYNTVSNFSSTDMFLAKYSTDGQVIWARSIGGTSWEEAKAIAIDSSGFIYVGGEFRSDTVFFANDTLINPAPGYADAFIAKYDTSGNEVWARSAGSIWHDQTYALATDQLGNVYITGGFMGSDITFGNYTLTNPFLYDFSMFFVKMDENGNTIWAKTAGGTSSVWANSISVDPNGDILIGGSFNSTQLIIGNDTMYTAGGSDVFIGKYDSDGNAIWARNAGGVQFDAGHSIITDNQGNSCIVGVYGSPSIVFGVDTLLNTGVYNMFITKYDENGNPLWSRNAGGTEHAVSANAITVDNAGDFYVGGNFYWPTLILDSDTLLNYDSVHYNNTFIAKYNAVGSEIWAKSDGGSNNDEIYSLAIDLQGNIYAAGLFGSPVMQLDTSSFANNSASLDLFVAKLTNQSVLSAEMLPNVVTEYSLYPNPVSEVLHIRSNGNNSIAVLCDSQSCIIGYLLLDKELVSINVSKLAPGVYFLLADERSYPIVVH